MSATEDARHVIRRYLALCHDDLHADGARTAAFMRAHYARFHCDIAGLIVDARTDSAAFDALAELQEYYIQTGETVPVNLALTMRDIARGDMQRPAQRGRRATKNRDRNSVICAAAVMARHYGLPLHDGGVVDETASTIIAELLQEHGIDDLGAEGVKQVIVRGRRSVRQKHP